jgi:rod shape-determining protein MreC
MESVLGRYRNLIILVGVLFLQVLGLAMQVKRAGGDTENTRLIRVWAVDAISPFERSVVWVQSSTSNIWRNYFYLRGVRAENRELKQQIEQMRLEQVRLSEDAAQARRLQTLLAFKEQFISKTVAAQVIGSSGSDLSRIIYIDKGADAGLRRDMAVITVDGVVGKVLLVYPSVSQVLLINDQTSGVGAILEKSRLQGVLRGTPNGELQVERVMSDEQVAVGETVLTSGGDQIFPKGLPVGTVTKVGNGKDLFLNIKIKPATNLSKLEEVLVLVEKQERQSMAEDNVRVRAADILAQRLPSVPDKAATDATTGTAPASGAVKAASSANAGTKPPTAGTIATPGIKNSAVRAGNRAPGVLPTPTAPARSAGAQKPPATTPATNLNGAKPVDPRNTSPVLPLVTPDERTQPQPNQSPQNQSPRTQPQPTQPQPAHPPSSTTPPSDENRPQ